jgi:LPS-assembly lipoprotein
MFQALDRLRGAALPLLLALGGCGFHPLYGPQTGFGYDPVLASVQVRQVPDHIGIILTDSLREQLNPRGVALPTRYTLSIALSVARSDLGLRRDATASRSSLSATAFYTLSEPGSNATVLKDSAHSTVSFNLADDPYAATVSEERASELAALDISRKIAQGVALALIK